MKNEEQILFWAFRYALGRMTYAVDDVVKAIIEDWNGLSEGVKIRIKKEIREAIEESSAGMQMDVNNWKKILAL